MADAIVINAKTQRPSVCNAVEKLLVRRDVAAEYVPRIVAKLTDAGVEVRGDREASNWRRHKACYGARLAGKYMRLCLAIRVVSDVDEAIQHINRYSTQHSDAILTRDENNARRL